MKKTRACRCCGIIATNRHLRLFRVALACALALSLPAVAASAEGEAELHARIDELFAAEMRAAGIPCAAVALTKDGEVVYAKGYGEARPGTVADADTPFFIGSVTKSMSALGLMTLVEAGKVDLEAPVAAYLPGFRMADPRYQAIKVADLLRQCSGLSTLQGISYLGDREEVSMGDLIGRLATERLSSEPGTRYQYSNYNYVLVGAIIEAVSGEPYAMFMAERIFKPLGMTRTSASLADSERNGLAVGSRGFFGWSLRGKVAYPEGSIPEGYVASSARDMAAYLAFMQRRGRLADGRSLLSPEGIQRMTSVQSATGTYGYGWTISPRGYYHAGEVAGFVTLVFSIDRDPSWGCAILLGKSDSTAEAVGRSLTRRFEIGLGKILGLAGAPALPPSRAWRYPFFESLLALLVLGAAGLSVLGLVKRMKKPHATSKSRHPSWKRTFSIAGAILLHLVLPLAVFLFPRFAGIPWSTMFVFSPDFPPLLLAFAILELLLGGIELSLACFRERRNRQA